MDGAISYKNGCVCVVDNNKLRSHIHKLASISALESGEKAGWAQYFIRAIAIELGIFPASIHNLYMAMGRGDLQNAFTVPALNLRVLAFDSACAAFRAARRIDATALIYEIARIEINFTDQRPAEYASSVLAAAIQEGYYGPIFLQGDHYQVSDKKYTLDADQEIHTIKELIQESIKAGFMNIDVDTSTMVDLTKTIVAEQQQKNIELSALLAKFIRKIQPTGVNVSIGGEIGEVGGHHSTIEELCTYLDGVNNEITNPDTSITGMSKISIHTGTTHGGLVLPDGSLVELTVDFDTMDKLSSVARKKYGLGGAVQHGASTLPLEAFGKFPDSKTCEIHLATGFLNTFFDLIPTTLCDAMYEYLDQNFSDHRQSKMTDAQFYYQTRTYALGNFKKQCWNLSYEEKQPIISRWEDQFSTLFSLLRIENTRSVVDQYVKHKFVLPRCEDYFNDVIHEDVRDLAG